MSEKKSEKTTKISMSVFPRLFLFYRVFGCFSAMRVQKRHKKRLPKNRVEKFLQKNRQKIQTRFFLDFLLSRFWAFLGEGSSKTRQKISKTNLTSPGTFLAPEERGTNQPTNHVKVRRFFLERPLELGAWRHWRRDGAAGAGGRTT
jgi:hypothetical protein